MDRIASRRNDDRSAFYSCYKVEVPRCSANLFPTLNNGKQNSLDHDGRAAPRRAVAMGVGRAMMEGQKGVSESIMEG